jgi:threonine dehydratase
VTTPTTQGIERARDGIDPVFTNSPVIDVDLDEVGAVALKLEMFNPIGSFKGRGASWFVANLPPDVRRVVCASAGNFGQGIAHAARRAGIEAVVYTSTRANPLKVARIERLGATVIAIGDDFDDAKAAGIAQAAIDRDTFVEDGRDPFVTEGAGTIAAELLEQRPDLTGVAVPVGNGALVNGIGLWMRAHAPHVRVVGVCASGAPAMFTSWRLGEAVHTPTADTAADGIAVRVAVPEAVELLATTVDDMVLVSEHDILQAVRSLALDHGVLAEPAGAAGFAAITARLVDLGEHPATIICGSNVDPALLAEVMVHR